MDGPAETGFYRLGGSLNPLVLSTAHHELPRVDMKSSTSSLSQVLNTRHDQSVGGDVYPGFI